MITTDSFRVVFTDPPPATVPGDPEGRQIQFYWLILRDGDTIVEQPTISPFEGSSFTFSNLMEGTTYSLEIDALVGDNFQLYDLDLEPLLISTRKYTLNNSLILNTVCKRLSTIFVLEER